MAKEIFPQSQLPIRRTVELLPEVFQTETNAKFMSAVVDPLVQPGTLTKTVGYVGRRYGKTYNGSDVYLDSDATLRSRYQLEPGVVVKDKDKIQNFYDYIDFKNQLKFFGNNLERDDLTTDQDHYSWNPPIDWDKFANFREYYWVPDGPPPITLFGQLQSITSTYRVRLGVGSSWIFFPDGLTLNPTITLYRGQTYKFQINAPDEGFVIKTAYDTGSLIYKPYLPYQKNQLAVFNNKLWKAKTFIPVTDGSTIDENSEDWEYLEQASQATALDYNTGVTGQGATNGTLTFVVPLDAPDVLFYQSALDINRFGRFIIADIESNTKINVTNEIVGKTTYTSSNNIVLTNGMKVRFSGQVVPVAYSTDTWIVEGVGESIKLVRFQDLNPPTLSTTSLEVLFDDGGFDTEPFDDASSYPEFKDYITINRVSQDSNPWSRYNRWFHKSVLEQAYKFNDSEFDLNETARAKRPIIEFNPNLQLFNHGSLAKTPVDFIDTFTADVFSTIEGSLGYNIDGEEIFNGARLLVTADTDSLANNRIYTVNFITHNNRRQINLIEATDGNSTIGDGVFVRRGLLNKGIMYHFNGISWVPSQKKTAVNQSPLFDVFDDNGVSYGDMDTYPVSSFLGTKLVSYKVGNSVIDKELGFSLSYLNIDNVGDIEFNFDWDIDTFDYHFSKEVFFKTIRQGYYKFTDTGSYANGWIKTDRTYLQSVIYSTTVTEVSANSIISNGIKWVDVLDSEIYKILIYINGLKYSGTYTRNKNIFTFPNALNLNDVVVVKVYAAADPYLGYYEIPLGLEKNPLNSEVKTFTLGQAIDHVSTAVDLFDQFSGVYPGVSNLRDISGYQNLARRFLKHSGITPTAIMLLCDKQVNVIKSIQYAKKSYTEFKNSFIKFAETSTYDLDPVEFVDQILATMSKIKTQKDAFADSDMVGCGAYVPKDYIVEDIGIKTFALSEKFDLTQLSRKAVYVYIDNTQLLHGIDYTFNSTFGFVTILKDLVEGDVIQIREYISSSFCFIPATPTKLGLYKKYTPSLFLDDTYVTPTNVIRGHDGSITVAYGDFRDEVLLELEKRIYNNIKQEYTEDLFSTDAILGGYYGSSIYSKQNLDSVISSEFLRWLSETNIDYLTNSFFDSEDSFTYTYSNMGDPTGQLNLPGWWRGVYVWLYDTTRPHSCPWEMLGFSEKPTWWTDQYGPAPYTSNNLLLWEDLAAGIIRQGSRAGSYDRYKRATLLSHIPVDGDGNLLSPFDSGSATNFVLYNNKGTFKFGDIAPVEYAWRSSSDYPFVNILALCLMRPYEFIIESLDKSRITVNKIGQTVNKNTNLFFKNSDIAIPISGGNQTSGLLNYVVDHLRSKGLTELELQNKLDNLDVSLSTRLSGFVDQEQQKYILDSKNPKSTSSSIFIPQENYDINFNISAPIASPSYSAVVVEKLAVGWKVFGYDVFEPYFKYFEATKSSNDPLISVGGVSEDFIDWEPNKVFSNGTIIRASDLYYRCLKSHTSGIDFDLQYWQRIAKLPLVGAVEVLRRRTVNKTTVKELPYGTVFTSLQEISDFIIGYDEYLKSQGFEFNGYDGNLESSKDWITSIKELLFWSKHKWAENSLITLSPAAARVELNINIGVADNLLDSFYDYNILKDDGTLLPVEFINVNREFQKLTVDVVNDTDGIYFFRCYFVLKEHVTIFDDRTVFNDVLYDKPTGYRQERIKSRGFRTVDWDGDYTSPGFLFDNVNIQPWQPFTDYRLGDIVAYKSYNWTSLVSQQGSITFNDSNWTKLDTTPTKGLVSNFDVRVSQFEDYYNVDADGAGASQRDLSRHLIGYQPREYLQNLAEDAVTQFKLYQGFIREKGTANAVVKVFDKLSRITADSIVLDEEWAFNVGRLGGLDQLTEIEFEINKDDFVVNPQAMVITDGPISKNSLDKYLRVNQTNFTRSLIPYNININPVSKYEGITRNAGYVKIDQTEILVKTRDDILTLDITSIVENSHIWITFDNASWNVLRFNLSKALTIEDFVKNPSTNIVTVSVSQKHGLSVDEIVGIKDIDNLTGFYKVVAATDYTFSIQTGAGAEPNAPDTSTIQYNIYLLTEARFSSYQDMGDETAALLKEGSKLWIDNSDTEIGNWEVVEKQRLYSGKSIIQFGATDPRNAGKAVVYASTLKQTITGIPSAGSVMAYAETTTGLSVKQILQPEAEFTNVLANSFGNSIAISPDNLWLAVGAPLASGVPSRFKGSFDTNGTYVAGDIVFNGKLWEATEDQTPGGSVEDDGSTNTLNELSEKFRDGSWKLADIVYANASGEAGPIHQGMIVLYKWKNNYWELQHTILSPRIAAYEKFGSNISIGVSGNNYYMSVSAPGSLDNLGRVYLYKYTGTSASSTTQILTFNGTSAINYTSNTIAFSKNHNLITGQIVRYLNGTYTGEDKSSATSPPPPEDYTILYVIRITDTIIQLSSSIINATSGVEIDLKDFGIDDSSSHTLISTVVTGWKQLGDSSYRGIYRNSSTSWYTQGSKVWHNGKIYQALEDTYGDGSSLDLSTSAVWQALDESVTEVSLPSNIALVDIGTQQNPDSSTAILGSIYPLVTAGNFIVGETYTIEDFGTTNFQLIGYNPEAGDGLTFKATGVGSGTGKARWKSYQFAELIKAGDMFGESQAMNRDGSVLVIGAPESDGIYIANYRGLWVSYQTYYEDDVVKYNGNYYRLVDYDPITGGEADSSEDSTYITTSKNDDPKSSSPLGPWTVVRSESSIPSGKIFIYKRNSSDVYELAQTITAGSLTEISDVLNVNNLNTGDKFGAAVDIDYNGNTVIASSPLADVKSIDQGAVFVFKTEQLDNISYRLKQKLISHENYANEYFGSAISISPATERIVIGAKNATFNLFTIFDQGSVTFDNTNTTFSSDEGNTGQVYVFERKDQTYHLTEKLYVPDLQDWESFGSSIDCVGSVIAVGSPTYRDTVYRIGVNFTTVPLSPGIGLTVDVIIQDGVIVSATANDSGAGYSVNDVIEIINPSTPAAVDKALIKIQSMSGGEITSLFVTYGGSGYKGSSEVIETGQVRLFTKDTTKNSWNTLTSREDLTNLELFKNISIYDNENNVKISDIEIVDHYKLKILGAAEQELKFKTLYDPATYTNGTDQQEVDESQAWFEKYVGQLWWDLSTAKWLHYEQSDVSYRIGNWNQLAYGASIDVYEWVESKYLPSRWATLAETTEGLSLGISGQPLYADNTVYSVKVLTNSSTGETTSTKYYYWVKNKNIVPKNTPGRRISALDVKSYIENPIGTGQPILSPISADTLLAFNFESLISSNTALVNIQYRKNLKALNSIHNEYQLLTEGVADSLPTDTLETKWIDSLVGYDLAGNIVPDVSIPIKQRYGLSFRPRQGMFKDRFPILKTAITNINTILKTRAFADTLNFKNLGAIDQEPNSVLNEYDVRVDTLTDLDQVGTTRVKKAILRPNIVDGEIDTIDIIDPGFGYKNAPFITIEGNGQGAVAEVTVDSQGRINSVIVKVSGRRYTTATVQIRYFSVLVAQDSSINNYWSIYAWDNIRKAFFRSKSQAYDTTKYWEYIDWWQAGYGTTSRIVKEIVDLYQEPSISVNVGDLIRVKEFANGGWAVLEKTDATQGNILDNYILVGRQNGTINLIIDDLVSVQNIGYDNTVSFDANIYDLNPTQELRNILKAAKEDIFIEDLRIEWNKLFFTCIRYAFVEQPYIDWAFKTSFLNATHNVGDLAQKISYKNDNLESFQEYIEEIKPYRTTIREYTSKYTDLDTSYSGTTDFDLPPAYSVESAKILPIASTSDKFSSYPWKWWADNNGYAVTEIKVSNGGTDYTEAPSVVIEGTGAGATAQAFVANGSVVAVKVLTKGTGYTAAPTVRLVGGNGTSQSIAKAVATIGETAVRTFDLTVKFDRIAKQGTYQTFTKSEIFTATGYSAVFELRYAPNRDKSKISITKNNQIVLNSEYTITLYTSSIDTYSLIKGKLIFNITPELGDIIEINYEKNVELFDSINRIENYYAPTNGMRGNELAQLMTGIDFGGVQIQGTTFDVTGGWDALPWFTDSWDSVESNSDFYYVADGSTIAVTLPFIPAAGEQISVYWKPSGTRIPSSIQTLGNQPDGYAVIVAANNPAVLVEAEVVPPKTIRVDDPNWIENWDSSNATNPNAQMPTFIGDGSTRVVEIGQYISIEPGDTLIFRKLDSDGSVTITDVNLLDTKLTGGSLSNISGAYQTATGLTAEEIIIDGDKFISPDQVPAPEENVPGQVLESVSIKVFHTYPQGSALIQNTIAYSDGIQVRYNIGIDILENNSIIVYINKTKQELGIDYSIDYVTNEIVFNSAPANSTVVEILAFGLGGIELLDYQEFVADGATTLFLTKAIFSQTASILATVDGISFDARFIDSADLTDTEGRTLVQFGFAPDSGSVVKVVCLGSGLDTDSTGQSIIRVNRQTIAYDGSSTRFVVDKFVNLSRASAISSILVNINDQQLKGPDTVLTTYDGTNNEITIGVDPRRFPGSITYPDIKVYVNNDLAIQVVDWTLNSGSNVITVRSGILNIGDIIRIVVTAFSDYQIDSDEIIFTDAIMATLDSNDDSTTKDIIEIIWFSEYPSMDIVSDQYPGGKVQYQLSRSPVNSSYIWVYVNGVRLTQDKDYSVSLSRGVVYLNVSTTTADDVKIVEFGNNVYKFPSAFEIYKDMLNVYHFKRYSRNDVTLATVLNYYDQTITVTNGDQLFDPTDRRVAGIVYINNERIEYLQKSGNTLSQLRRGSLGTAIAELHSEGSYVTDSGPLETIPYNEIQHRLDFVSDGSTLLVGPLDIVPTQGTRNNWFKSTIPEGYGPCDQLEVFVAGTRLRKNPIEVFDEDLGPNGSKEIEAEFSVDGASPYIRLTSVIPAGTRITIIRKTGRTWYDRGVTTASAGKTLQQNKTAISEFILQKTTIIPE